LAREVKFGGARGSRTPDLLNAIQALSQLSYGPVRAGGAQKSEIRKQKLECDRSALRVQLANSGF
jgi:hypothetical protein